MLKSSTTSGDANATTTTGAGGVQNIFAILHILNIYSASFSKNYDILPGSYGDCNPKS